MGCGSCGSAKGETAGCSSGCASGSCNKKNVFDWLSNMDLPIAQPYTIVEVRFKAGKKGYFNNHKQLELYKGDAVVVAMDKGYHVGNVSLQGDLVRIQMKKKGINPEDKKSDILRHASDRDIEKWNNAKAREISTMYKAREIIRDLNLKMKLSDVEFQADNTKATFYYSADNRVDFRELIKLLATAFHVRIEMRQISLRQEAGRLGGLGSCGRELCCSTWLSSFKTVSTPTARYQNLSLNPSKLSGQCGRLKCCLNYELETYLEALKDIPKIDAPLQTEKGLAFLQKTDIFKKIMWFSYDTENAWYPLHVSKVNHILELNKTGKVVPSLQVEEWNTKKTTNTNAKSKRQRDMRQTRKRRL